MRITVSVRVVRPLVMAGFAVVFASIASAQQQFVSIAGAPCAAPPVLHCPDADCSSDRVINQGPIVEMKTRRTYFLDYPCDLKADEKVTFVLSLHGAGSYGNWQRHYFPIVDYKDKYRLVIATPNSPTHVWSASDDEYLQNIVSFVVDQIGKPNIKAFWLAGHSQGGLTSNRIVRTDFFKDRVDGWLSLSGGRLGPIRAARISAPSARRRLQLAPPAAVRPPGAGRAALQPTSQLQPPRCASFQPQISRSSSRRVSARWTTKACQSRRRGPRSSAAGRGARRGDRDTEAGYIYDRSRQNPPNPPWGLLPRPGTAAALRYPNCKDGRVVADVVRLEKGHTEGLEPNVTEALVKLMLSARGGKIQQAR